MRHHHSTLPLGIGHTHRTLIATIRECRRGAFASYTPNLTRVTAEITLDNCRLCKYTRGEIGQHLVPTYTKFGHNKIMTRISIDIVGPEILKLASVTRNTRTSKCWMLAVICLSTELGFLVKKNRYFLQNTATIFSFRFLDAK